MPQRYIPARFVRGGTSKGVFFLAEDLPEVREEQDAVFLAALGSPDPNGRQLDGLGGGLSSLSKVAVLGVSAREDADVDYTFGQVAVDETVVDRGVNCGNLAAAVGPVAVESGLVPAADGPVSVRIHATNTGQVLTSTFEVRDGEPVVDGDLRLDGVAGTGAPVRLEFHDPAASVAAALLPTGNARDVIEVPGVGAVEVSLVDAPNPVVFVAAAALGLAGDEPLEALDADADLLERVDRVRRAGAVAMGLGERPEDVGLANPKIALLSPPRDFRALDGATVAVDAHDLGARMVSMGRWHRAVTSTGALCLAVAAAIEGTLPAGMRAGEAGASPAEGDDADVPLRIGQPSGVTAVSASVRRDGDGWHAESASMFRTARTLMRGEVAVRL